MLIRELTLYTQNPDEQFAFYSRVLGLEQADRDPLRPSFRAGHSTLRLVKRAMATPYHFAFNIPCGREKQTLEWLRGRATILRDEDRELVHFPRWNASSIYFYDADHNIVEFIARKNLGLYLEQPFSADYLLGISEIGMAVDSIRRTYESLKQVHPLNIYDGNFDQFCAAGDEEGLFIIIDKNKKRWFPSGDIAYPSEFIIDGDFHFRFVDGKVQALK